MRAIPFLLHEALVNFRRHRIATTATITTLAVALTLCGGFVLFSLQARHLASRTIDAFEMRVFCRPERPRGDIDTLGARLRKLPGVSSVAFESRETIFAREGSRLPIDLRGVPNLMPDTYTVKLTSAKAAPRLAATVRGWVEDVDAVELPEAELSTLVRLADILRVLGIGLGTLLMLGALILVANTIRLSVFARRREIRIMQIVGATAWFIRLPLLIEGFLHGALGGALAGALLGMVVRSATDLTRSIPLLALNALPIPLALVVSSCVVAGMLLGVSGAAVAVHRYLKG